ncbi:uncharacterized protein LOC105634269 [Jatropha curcas]|uniref:uncharacterized protein LOC105634269 n=1 Tax=Jatropha curcas TaxID=180498 RepID=UPI00189418EE|nr:uncharacterized protein LOC105634269 [Jatropha curcas]
MVAELEVEVGQSVFVDVDRISGKDVELTPTLARRGLELDTGCDYCGNAETLVHALVECPRVSFCWQFFGIQLTTGNFPTFLQLLEHLHKLWENEFFESFVMGLWSVWSTRNELKWNQVEEGPYHVVTRARSMLASWKKAQLNPSGSGTGTDAPADNQWFPPPVGTFKINFDATLLPSVGHGAVGAVISNCNSRFVSAATSSLQDCSSPAVAEAQTLRTQRLHYKIVLSARAEAQTLRTVVVLVAIELLNVVLVAIELLQPEYSD